MAHRISPKAVTMIRISRADAGNTTIKGVHVACIGEEETGVDELTTCDVAPNHYIFAIGQISPISKLIGIPTLVCKLPPKAHWPKFVGGSKRKRGLNGLSNPIARDLMWVCHPTSGVEHKRDIEWLQSQNMWSRSPGSVVVIRADGKPLFPHQVEVLLEFLARMEETYPEPDDNVDILAGFMPGDFKDYYMDAYYCWKPTPWTQPAKRPVSIKRNEIRSRYRKMTYMERARKAEDWKESFLLREIHSLKLRLGEANGVLEIGPEGKESKVTARKFEGGQRKVWRERFQRD